MSDDHRTQAGRPRSGEPDPERRRATTMGGPDPEPSSATKAGRDGASIYAGSRGLRYFDAAVIGYAAATIFLAFGVTYRYAVWASSPPARRYLIRGWQREHGRHHDPRHGGAAPDGVQAFLSWRNFRRMPGAVPRSLVGYLGFQRFIGERSRSRWIAHQLIFWGVVLATLITFPLSFGWFAFLSDTAAGPDYTIHLFGVGTVSFDSMSPLGWLLFHGLDVAAVLVLAGCGYFLWRRFRRREATTGQRFAYDFVPLIALVAISVTGLLLTFSSSLLEGRGYEFLAVLHMAVVVLTLMFIPFGKFFHVIQRPASVGVEVYKRAAIANDGMHACRRCGQPLDARAFVADLKTTMDELGLGFSEVVETCPRCKRLQRGEAYLSAVKRGFK
jgi:hypothetical protein